MVDSLKALYANIAAQKAGARVRVFDWNEAARLIRIHQPKLARAGLGTDWDYTGGDIYRNGAPVPKDDTYTYLASNWATPELDMDGDVRPCWVYMDEAPGWGAATYWPESALEILNE